MKTVKNAKREGRRVTVTLDGGEKLRLTAPLWDSLELPCGVPLTEEDEGRLRAASSLSETVTDAMRMASDSPLSCSALATRLVRRGHPKEDALRAVAALTRSGALDETENARHVARSIFTRTHRGPARIRADLSAKGFPRAAAEDAANTITDEEYREALRRVAEGRREEGEKLVAALARFGFPISMIKDCLK